MSRVRVGDQGLLVGETTVPVYSGTVHYWRLERERWPAILDACKRLGFGVLETYIPWSVHETAPGVFDWGEQDPRKDVEAFMRLCEDRGLWLLVRPGPLINAELTDFGFPEWVLLDPDVQSWTAFDTPHLDAAWGLHPPHQFPVPSYASERFFELVGGWFDRICPIIGRHLAPDGCVLAVQSDNETCYLFFDQPYATDYSPASLRLYRQFLAEQYGSIEALNARYATSHATFDDVEPPRDGPIPHAAAAPLHLDWVAYKEFQIRWSVARVARMLRERGLASVPIFHDVAFQYTTPLDIARMEADPDIDWVGLNLYRPPWEHRQLADRVRFLAGSTKLPFVPELGAGLWSHHPVTALPAEHEFVTLSVLMYGIKAFNFYMLVERDRWQGSPLTRHGTPRPDYAPVTERLMLFLKETQLWRFRRTPRALVLLSYDLGRLRVANSTLNYGHVDLLRLPPALFQGELAPDLALRWPPEMAAAWLETLTGALRSRSIDYDLGDTHLDAERLRRYPVVFVQAGDGLDPQDAERLLAYADAGGTLVLGPGLPQRDGYLQPCDVLHQAHARGAFRVAETRELPSLVDQLLPVPAFRVDPPAEVVVHTDGSRRLVFVSNPTDTAVSTQLCFDGPYRFVSVWGEPGTLEATDRLELELAAYTLRVWQLG